VDISRHHPYAWLSLLCMCLLKQLVVSIFNVYYLKGTVVILKLKYTCVYSSRGYIFKCPKIFFFRSLLFYETEGQ
jgi:hypothetical protein